MSISTAARSFCLSHRARHLLAAVLSKKSAGDLQEGTAQIRIWVVPSLFKQPRLHETTRFSRSRLRRAERLCYTSGMPDFAAPVERLIDELKHLPGIGQKTAQRLAFHLLRAAPEDALALADAIRDAKEKIRACSVCHNITDADPCLYCVGRRAARRRFAWWKKRTTSWPSKKRGHIAGCITCWAGLFRHFRGAVRSNFISRH